MKDEKEKDEKLSVLINHYSCMKLEFSPYFGYFLTILFPTLGSHVEFAWPISRNSRIYKGPSSPLYRIFLRVAEFWMYLLKSEYFILTSIAATYANH